MSAEHATAAVLGLTARQAEIFGFLFGQTQRTGIQPSVRDVNDAFGYKSGNAAHIHFKALRRKGWIVLPGGRASRSVRFLRNPDGTPFRGFVLPSIRDDERDD